MTWFKVDDHAHSNNKIRKVLAEMPSALALWTVAGSWSADNLTDGFVPDHQLPWLIPAGTEEMAAMLVTARLWRRVRGGYQFHQWEKDGDGTARNPSRSDVEKLRAKKAEAGRKGGLTSGSRRSKPEARASASASPSADGLLQPPSRPLPSKEGRTGLAPAPARSAARAPRDEPPPPTDFDDPKFRARIASDIAAEQARAQVEAEAAAETARRGREAAMAALGRSPKHAVAEPPKPEPTWATLPTAKLPFVTTGDAP